MLYPREFTAGHLGRPRGRPMIVATSAEHVSAAEPVMTLGNEWAGLERIAGTVLGPDDEGYDAARQTFNGTIDLRRGVGSAHLSPDAGFSLRNDGN